jgi:hypothetical protein
VRPKGGLGKGVVVARVPPVNDRGDTRLGGAQQADEGGGVHVVRSVAVRALTRRVGVRVALAEVAEQRGPRVAVRVDEPRHHDRVGRVDVFGVPGVDRGADLGDHAVLDQDVGLLVVGGSRAERQDAPAGEQDPGRHARSSPVAPAAWGDAKPSGSARSLPVPLSSPLIRAPLTVQGHYTGGPIFARPPSLPERGCSRRRCMHIIRTERSRHAARSNGGQG